MNKLNLNTTASILAGAFNPRSLITGATPQELAGTAAAIDAAQPISLIKRIPIVEGRRIFVVGDLHGCYDMLMELLKAAEFDFDKDLLLATGDLGDRGPDSAKCIRLIGEKWFESVAGNHEEMLIRAATEENFEWQWWIANGGTWATAISPDELFELADLAARLPLAIVVGEGEQRFNVIHAEFHGPDAALEDVLDNVRPDSPVPLSLTWGRDLIEGKVDESVQDGLSITFVGHAPVETVCRVGNQVYIDTGAFIASRRTESSPYCLTMIEPLTGKFWQHSPNEITGRPAEQVTA